MKLRVTFALLAGVVLTTAIANAQMSEGERKAAARAAYTEGVTLQDKGSPADALTRFEAAQKLFDAPTHLLHIAECQALTGKLVEASETYETLVRRPLGKDAPEAFVQAQEQGRAELAHLRPRIPTMRVTVKPDAQSLRDMQITVNEQAMPVELVGIARPVNPGPYKFKATAAGWGTPAPVDVEVKEREAKNVELTLQQGPAGLVVVPTKPAEAPPSYEAEAKPKPKPPTSPSASGLLLGVHGGVLVPAGDVAKGRKFKDYATAGPTIGLDVIGRVARLFLIGGTLEYASLGTPSSAIASGTTADVSTSMIYAGVLAGIMPNVDRVTFVADAGLGMRFLSRSVTPTTPTNIGAATGLTVDDSRSALELAINAGISIPAGPIRIVPKAGLAFGQFSQPDNLAATATTSTSVADRFVDSATHTIFQLTLGVFYHLDFAKKSGAVASVPFGTTASR